MNRFKLFISNFIVYGLGGVIGKIIPLLMLPIITRLMPDIAYFGLNDISNVVVSFGSALAIFGMYDAMFRLFFEKEEMEYKKSICSSALAFTIATSLIVFLILLCFRGALAELFFSSREYTNLLMLSAMSILIGATNSIVAAPTRINNQKNVYLVTNLIAPLISYSISVPLLLKGWYVIALPLAAVISAFSMELIFWGLNRKWFSYKLINWHYIKQMLRIAFPLMPNFLIYWVFNSADRLMLEKIIGQEAVGVYAIGGKIGQMSQLIYLAFAGGWQYFSFSTMKDEDQVEMTSSVFEYLGGVAFIAIIFLTMINQWIFELFFTGDYVNGAIVAPYLFASPLLLMLFQIGSNQLLIIKKTWPNLLMLSLGAILNVLLNLYLIPLIGIEGAAIATFIGYIVSVCICVAVLHKWKLLCLSRRFALVVLLTVLYLLVWRVWIREEVWITLLLGGVTMLGIMLLFKRDIDKLLKNRKGGAA